MPDHRPTIIYTDTDEAPALATYSLLPIIKAFTQVSDINVETRDISLSGRIIASFSDYLAEDQRIPDALAELGEMTQLPDANIIKLPNISASVPQMHAAIKELQSKGYALPDYPEDAQTEEQKHIQVRYDRIKGSAVNPVLREGNSDRRAPPSVKAYARKHPHSMGKWSPDSQSHVAHMDEGDFYGSEKSITQAVPTEVKIQFTGNDGSEVTLKESTAIQAGEIIDASVMSQKLLREFLAREIENAREQGILFSLHLKATMMKVSDPVIFGHAVTVYYQDVFEKYVELFDELGVDPNNGIGDVYAKITSLDKDKQAEIKADLQ
ncbi:MAG: NADP-dependent isocitrate dehydrogenase, partial [Gammaproteobacteria bacterium]|nr:NADP-dependent isocitrate dehydrogenase [Gammaproteobacteria bacterium]